MARILMLVNQFSAQGAPADPPRQLAEAFVAEGHSVKVIALPWQHPQHGVERYDEHERLAVLRVPLLRPKGLGRVGDLLLRWVFSSWAARRHAAAFVGDGPVDLVYTTSPAVTTAFLIRWALRRFKTRSYLYVVDFFPFHQRAIGLVPGGAPFRLAQRAENALMKMFDVIGCMSPRGADYLGAHYALGPGQRVEVLPLSTGIEPERFIDRAAIRDRHGLPAAKILAIFGGQITEGRGIVEIVEAARIARTALPDLHFVLVGSGRLSHLVESYVAGGGTNLTLLLSLPRDAYLDLASACDIGLVVTVPIADIPTFPSKTLDYLQAALPVVAAVESGTDFRDFVDHHGFGLVVEAGNAAALVEALATLVRDPERRVAMAQAGRRTLHDVFDVRMAAKTIAEHAYQ